ncbi:type I DNA topoisomerase [Actinobacillus pleuropneumoniae]|uniref:type I DNA topoisomerase n=1 Tax=Actinobacillus pleuropneumoniae TaxID=715 RepID=UPI000584C093|nr:type I DNA topoisomerase [Actinobacillus pleuropneumoniae]KIE91470.1 putative DNA topoisomerase 1 [Actinobacillus pleuropneumoniae]KIE92153.1 putative DNA topoisomerase 1 [Actinobacillus pleuropneumoniae]KIE98884.1 putative DNA topoisomerase 1 [Actinobacillus pleuropneumoniae]QXP22761.1 type I DNA topoisomerase [Actinobacillus pleuropneumoniae serovar 8 str. 405]UKH36761.1 type I DNA topoisomerase [Actinobacillus pleuropneumoniae serovar 8 str. 405]
MGKSLVIVESPAKAKTINKYLGSDYVVKSSVGHIRDLPKSGSESEKGEKAKPISTKGMTAEQKAKLKAEKDRAALVKRMGIDPYHDWKANYQILPDKEKVVSELKSLAKKADHIYLATDLDREGEAIAWHLREVIGGDDERFSRVVFNEITRNAIQKAFEQPDHLNLDRVNAQQTRRFLDRVVGFMVSPLLWKKVARGLSAGRVQSVAVKLLVEREREIKAFQPEEYWEILANTLTAKGKLPLDLTGYKGKKFSAKNQKQADEAVKSLQGSEFIVSEIDKKPTSSKASPPFITSTLQQTASTRLGFGVKKTMMLAQRLYEAGYITYMRTDSTNLSQDALAMARGYIENKFGNEYLPAKPNFYSSKEGAQEAHEAIRPSDVNVKMSDLKGMEKDAERLYELIWRRFLACQMTPARYDSTSLTVTAGDYELKAKGRVLRFDGWTKALPVQGKTAEDQVLPEVALNEKLTLEAVLPSQHFTKPPARFSEAALVKELEKRGIGRPSTYAAIISTIQERGYVRTENRRFYAEKMGEIVTDRLDESFSDLMNYDFTANMEETLDQIAEGNKNWKEALNNFFKDFSEQLTKAELDELEGGMKPNSLVPTEIDCPTCGRKMAIRTASTGVFLGCTGYALPPKERCKTTMNLIPEAELLNVLDEESEAKALLARKRCPKCDSAMDSYVIDPQRKLHICGNNPNCDGYVLEQGTFKIKGYDGPIVECDKCGADMHLKLGRFGKYMGCTACDNTRKILKNGEVAPPREEPTHFPELKCEKSDAYFVLRDGASGVFMSAHNFPKSRETRAPKVAELAQYRDRLPEKLQYLADAPQQDPEGNEAIIRFSRKEKRQYVTSEKDGKATKWIVDYLDGKWVERKK